MARRELFSTLRTEGGLLPPDFIRRLAEGVSGVPGLRPADYHLVEGEKLSEAASRAWNRLQPAWAAFQKAVAGLPKGDPATGITREKWLQPLFHELGYGRLLPAKPVEIEEKQYPVSHSWQRTPIHLVGCGVDLDRRTAGVVGAAKASPHSLVQELLNRSDDHLWGIVSNGLRLRLLRDNRSLTRQAYVEFDLAAMLEGQVYADFALLFLLLHQSRVEAERAEECWLERWAQAAAEQGTRALDRLRSGVEEAITALGRGFLAHSANVGLRDRLHGGQLDRQDYYRQLLRLVYRLIFLFVAEDREVLHAPAASDQARARYRRYYSTRRLRDLAQSRRGTAHGDLWQALGLVMRGLGSEVGVPAMGLPALGSFLWSDDALPELQGCQLANTSLLQAVRSLATSAEGGVLQVVDYRNLGPEELGSVYEALLEQHPEVNGPAGTFDLKTAAGHERKTTGSYYTPTSLIECLLDSALDPVLVEAAKKPDPEKAILDLKVCDPACGSGHFLIAAAHRMARRLAAVRTGDEEPAPEAIRTALRDVIGRCLHGVDINPMAVELCKVNLWLEALDPGKPLSFLDHHIQCGNSLLGATPELIEKGIPDEAFEALEGDDKAICRSAKARNKKERGGGQRSLLSGTTTDPVASLARAVESVEQAADGDVPATRAKARLWEDLLASPELRAARLVADAWCGAFVAPRSAAAGMQTITQGVLELLRSAAGDPKLVAGIDQVAREYQLFHWHLAFPAVFARGGFDVVLGNPPWERLKLQEQEFFAERHPGIAAAPNAAARGRMIKALAAEDPGLYASFQAARRRAEGESALVRQSGRYPLCGRGDVNTYAVFSELNRSLLGPRGRAGFIVPSGIATDDTTKFFFQDITDRGSLVSLLDFQSGPGLFVEIGHATFKFCLLTLCGSGVRASAAEFAFFLRNTADRNDSERRFSLTAEDIALLNPNTRTCPIFRTRRDAELTKAIYRRVPVLVDENEPDGNPWGVSFLAMLHMSNDSGLFRTARELEADGWTLRGNVFERDAETYLPLYEAKMVHHFNHRFGDYRDQPQGSENTALPDVPDGRLADPDYSPLPRYWVPAEEVWLRAAPVPAPVVKAYRAGRIADLDDALAEWIAASTLDPAGPPREALQLDRLPDELAGQVATALRRAAGSTSPAPACPEPISSDDLAVLAAQTDRMAATRQIARQRCPRWFLGWRDITKTQNERTVIASVIPQAGVGNKLPLMLFGNGTGPKDVASLACCLTSFALDYGARQKLGGTTLNYFIYKQLPILAPSAYRQTAPWAPLQSLREWLAARAVELIYSSRDLVLLAQALDRPASTLPPWDPERRFLLRCELDAAFFRLYGIARDDVAYIMDTFPIVRRNDEKAHGEYRTKRVILEIYDALQESMATGRAYRSDFVALSGGGPTASSTPTT
jgi:hypothetical protein